MTVPRVTLAVLAATLVTVAAATAASAQAPVPASAPGRAYGRIVKVEGDSVVVRVRYPGGGEDVTITTDEHTRVLLRGARATLADVRPGMFVQSIPRPAADGRPAHLELQVSVPAL